MSYGKTKFLPILLTLSLAMGSVAHAALIGFEGVSAGTATPFSEAGFDFSSNLDPAGLNGVFDDSFGVNTNGSNIFGWCSGDCGPNVIKVSGPAAFSLNSIDVGYLDVFAAGMMVELTGALVGGGTVFVSLPIEQGWTTHPIVGFADLVSLSIVGIDPTITVAGIDPDFLDAAIDNLDLTVVATIPEPSSLLLLGSGLVGLICYRRRRKP